MNAGSLLSRLREICHDPLPVPGAGATAQRHRRLLEIGCEDLSLARLAEAHFDAIAILAEAGREPAPGAIYGVWAAEIPDKPVQVEELSEGLCVTGHKMFASGSTIVDRALVTVDAPDPWLLDVDLRGNAKSISFDTSVWKPSAFGSTKTASVKFQSVSVPKEGIVGERGWYLTRPGFWHGACGPAACWAGGAIGIVDYARLQQRSDPHTLAHLGALDAAAWALQSILNMAGDEIDQSPNDVFAAHRRALQCRHLVEQFCSEILERFGRAYGPYPLAFTEDIGRRCQELTIYLRQCHAERDLDALGHLIQANPTHK